MMKRLFELLEKRKPTEDALLDDMTPLELLDAAKLYLKKANEKQTGVTFAVAAFVNHSNCSCNQCGDAILEKRSFSNE